MPSLITHQLIAEQVLGRLPDEIFFAIDYPDCYYTGALGADPFFFYRPFKYKGYNLGKIMHRKNVGEFMSAMRDAVGESGRETAYACGYVTHYAADVTFHPYVYELEREVLASLPQSRKKDKIHCLIERDIDCFVAEEYTCAPIENYEYPVSPSEADFAAIFRVLEKALWKAHAVRADFDSVRNSIKRFIAQQKYFLDPHGNRRRNFYALEKIFFAPHMLSYMFLRDDPDLRFANYLHEKRGCGDESVPELAERAIDTAVELTKKFLAAKKGAALDAELFSTDQNIGKDVFISE